MGNASLVGKRKAAFRYLKVINGIPESSIDEITDLADALGDTYGLKHDLIGLRDGTINPTERLIDAFRDTWLVGKGGTISEADIQANLIKPFESE